MHNKLTVVIVNYRSWNYLSKCIDSLLNQKFYKLQIIVVDNFSNDGKIKKFKLKYSNIQWIELNYNSGFSKACNIGANKSKTKWILFLNPDSVLPNDCLNNLIPICEKNNLGVISIRSKNAYLNKSFSHGYYFNFWTVTNFIRQFYLLFKRNKRKIKTVDGFKIIMVGWVSGSFLLLKKKDFDTIGGWDERFWMYSEDMDFGKRAFESNVFPCVIYDMDYYHMHGGSSRKNDEIKLITKSELIVSKHIFIDKHLKGLEGRMSHFLLIIVTSLNLIFLFPFSSFHRSLFIRLLRYWKKSIKNDQWKSLFRENNNS